MSNYSIIIYKHDGGADIEKFRMKASRRFAIKAKKILKLIKDEELRERRERE